MAYLSRTAALATMTALPTRPMGRVLSGVHLPEYQDPAVSIATYVNPLGVRPAMLGTTVYTGAADDLRHQGALASVLTAHALAGGIVLLDIHPANPTLAAGLQRLATVSVGNQNAPKPSLAALRRTAPASTARTLWWQQVDRLIKFLNSLPDGMTVVLRFFHEMNGKHFWFGFDSTANPNQREQDLIKLILEAKDYILANTKIGILWAHSGEGRDYYAPVLWGRAPGMDLGGCSLYTDDGMFPNKFGDTYKAMTADGIPCGFWEIGPSNATKQYGTWDCRTIITTIRKRYPLMGWANTWQDNAPDVLLSLAHNQHAIELLVDPWMVNLPELGSVTVPDGADVFTAVRVLGEFSTLSTAQKAYPGEHYIHGKVT